MAHVVPSGVAYWHSNSDGLNEPCLHPFLFDLPVSPGSDTGEDTSVVRQA